MANKFYEALKLGAWITATVLLVNFLLSQIGIEVIDLYVVQGATGITGTIGSKLIQTINGLGIITINPLAILYLYISAVAIILVGSFAYGMFNFPRTRKQWTRLTMILLYGTAVFYVVFVGLVMESWQVIGGLIAHTGLVAISFSLGQGLLKKIRL